MSFKQYTKVNGEMAHKRQQKSKDDIEDIFVYFYLFYPNCH